MYFRCMKKGYFVILLSLLFSCRSQDTIDPKLIGKWTDTNTIYEFRDDNTYSTNYLRVGVLPNSVLTDSVFGEYTIETKRSNITFDLRGYRPKNGVVIDSSLNSTTWNYSIENDTILNYESNTTLGNFKKIQ